MPQRLRVLIASPDLEAVLVIAEAVRAGGRREVVLVDNGRQLAEAAAREPRPHAFILDARLPDVSAEEACRALRRPAAGGPPYVLVIVSQRTPEALRRCLLAGADDALGRPISPDLLEAHLDVARARQEARASRARQLVAWALLDAAREGSGELVVRGGQATARIYLHDGKVAWIHLAGAPTSLLELLPADSGVDEATAAMVIEECRARHTPLSDTLVRWGLVGREQLAKNMRRWLRERLAVIQGFRDASTLFLPQGFSYADSLLFTPLELLDEAYDGDRDPDAPPFTSGGAGQPRPWDGAFFSAPQSSAAAQHIVADCSHLPGARAAAVLDRRTGACLGSWGSDLDADIAWSFLQLINSGSSSPLASDITASTGENQHLALAVPGKSELAVYVVLRSDPTRLALAPGELRRALGRRTDAPGPDGEARLPVHTPERPSSSFLR